LLAEERLLRRHDEDAWIVHPMPRRPFERDAEIAIEDRERGHDRATGDAARP
jgi:hypothetical protein